MGLPDKTARLKGDLLFWRLMGATYQAIADHYGLAVSTVWKSVHRWQRVRL